MATTPDDILINAVMQAESRGKRFDKAGKLLTSVKGAEGEMQVMPTTQTKPGFGVTPAQDSSAEEKARVGRDYLKAMISKYGDTTTALAAYNWGPGKVNKWLEKGGDFNKLPEETKKYIKTIQASLPKGSQLASAPPGKPPVKASTNRVAPAAPATPPVSITKEMVADLGPNYQAALAAMALGDTREDDDDEESIAERYAAKQEKLAEEAASVPPPRIAGMELTYQSPFPEEQIAQAPEGLAHGGVPRRGNSARDALRMLKEAQQQQQQPVQRAEGSPEEGEKTKLPEGGDSVRSRDVEDLLGSIVGMNLPERGKVLASNLRFTPTEGLNIGAINTLVQGMSPKDIRQFMLNLDVADKAGINLTKEGLQDIYANIKGENNTNYQASYNPRGKAVNLQRMGKEGNFGVTLSPDYQGAYYQSQFADGGVVRRAEGSPEEGEKAAATARDLYAQIKRSGESIDEGGLKYWTERAQSNQQSPEELQKEFMAAADVADDPYYEVNRMYQRINQTPDTEGFNYWVNRAQQEKLTPQQLGSQFIGGMPAITQAENRPGFGVGGQYGTYNGLPMLYAPEVDRVMDREQRVTGDLVNADNAIGWDPASMSGELSRGAAAAGVYRTPFRMGGDQQAFQGDLVGTAKQYGIDPEQYMQPTAGQYGQSAGSALNENALYKALDEKMKDYYAVQGYVPPAGTANSAFNRTDIGGDHARVMYQRVGDRLVPMENTLQYSNMQRAPKYSWTDYIAPAAIVAAPWALPYMSTIASAVNWGPIGAEVGKGALIGAGKSIIQGQNPITGAIQGGASGLIPSPFAKGGEAVNEYAPDIPQEREPSFGTRAGGWLSDKIVEGGMKLYSATSDNENLPASHRIFLDTFNKDQRGPITAKDFNAKELAELQNIIALNEKAKNGKGVGSIAYADYNTLPDTEKRTVEGDILKGKGSARSSLSNSLGQFNYRLNPKTQQYEIIDEYDFNPIQAKVAGKMRDVPPALYGDYITHSLSPEKGLRDLARMYGGRHMPPGKGRPIQLSVPVKRAGGSPEIGEYYQDPMGMDTGPITADTVKAMTLPQGLSAKEAMGALKGIAKEGVSNAESLGRGSAASFPGLAGDVESVFRDEKKRKFKTTDEILKTEMPKRLTTPTKEAAGFEEVGTYIDPTTGLPFAKGAAKAALAGLKSSGPQVEKALMKMAPGAEPSYIIPREASAGATLKNVDSLVNDYKIGVDNILPAYAPNRGPLLSMLDKKASDYFYNVYGSKNDPIRQAILDGKLPAYLLKDIKEYAKDPTVLNAARKGDKKALTKFDAIYDQLTGLTKAGERAGQPVYDLYGSTASRLPFFSRNVLIESLSTIPFNRLDKMTFPEAVIEGTNNYVKKIYGTEKKNLTFMPETSLK